MHNARIVGVSASLRNARNREGAKGLVAELRGLADEAALHGYLATQGNLHLDQYYQAGRAKNLPYDELYRELRKIAGHKGLSNSEVCLAAALWGALQEGAEVDCFPLADYFRADGARGDLGELRASLLASEGVIIATPVYFGDRSSLSQDFLEALRQDPELRAHLRGKVYGGCTVGAKRNGGQETSLIYQLHDMMDLGLLGVGNDFSTTSQYGGTGHAGDVGLMPKDEYGLKTSVGVGRRVARVASFMRAAQHRRLEDKLRVGVWLLQDKDDTLRKLLEPAVAALSDRADIDLVPMHEMDIKPCLACDICPAQVGPDEDYRCVRGKTDDMHRMHNRLLTADVIVAAMYSPLDRVGLKSAYQHFLERTRYLRRGDYAFTDRLLVPLVAAEVGTNENLNLRMTTSLIRHHTVLHRPVMAWLHKGAMISPEDLAAELGGALDRARELVAGRLSMLSNGSPLALYKPVGYVLSLTRDNLPETMDAREQAIQLRLAKLRAESRTRLAAKERD